MQYQVAEVPKRLLEELSFVCPHMVVEAEFPFVAVLYTPHKEVAEAICERLNKDPLPKIDIVKKFQEVFAELGMTSVEDFQNLK